MDGPHGVRLVAVEEYLTLSAQPVGHYELHHGAVVLVTPPKWGQQRLQRRIETLLKSKLVDQASVITNMPFQPAVEYEVWAAHVGVVLLERANAVPDDEYLAGSPELVVEVKSPSDSYVDFYDMAGICLKGGSKQFWLVEPVSKTIIVLYPDCPLEKYSLTDVISCTPLQREIYVQDVFPT